MRHPAAYPNFGNPREVRSFMHTTYSRYVSGQDLFPRARVEHPDSGPRKSRDIARALFNAWEIIDEDNAYFQFVLTASVKKLQERDKPSAGRVIAKAGRNAVNFAFIKLLGGSQPGNIAYGTLDSKAIIDVLNDTPLDMTDGRRVAIIDGDLQPEPLPDGIIVRRSGRSAIFVAQRGALTSRSLKPAEPPR